MGSVGGRGRGERNNLARWGTQPQNPFGLRLSGVAQFRFPGHSPREKFRSGQPYLAFGRSFRFAGSVNRSSVRSRLISTVSENIS